MKTLQILSEEYIQKSKKLSLMERLVYLEEYRLLLPKSLFDAQSKEYTKNWTKVKEKSASEFA